MITISTFTLEKKGCYHHMISTRLNNTENRSAVLENIEYLIFFFFVWHNSPQWARTSSFTRFLDHTQRRTTVGRTPLDE